MEDKIPNNNVPLKWIANGISILLHPIFMPLVGCVLLYYCLPDAFVSVKPRLLSSWLGMIIINTIVFPLILMLLLKGLGFIKSILLKDVKERVIPLIGIMVFYFWPYLVAKNEVPIEAAKILLFGNFIGIVIVFITTIFFKVSMHTSGVGSLLGFLLVLMILSHTFLMIPFFIILMMALIINWARFYNNAHSKTELFLGLAIGIVAQLAAYLYI